MATGLTRKNHNKRSSNHKLQQLSMVSNPSFSPLNYRKISWFFSLLLIFCLVFLLRASPNNKSISHAHSVQVPLYTIEVLNVFPHDPKAFTQGLLYAGNDTLFESTGLYTHSSVREVALLTGQVEALHKMDNTYFGEGLTLFGDRLFQVTWLTNTGFIYDRNNLSKINKFTHQMQDGWGLATDEKVLFGSDGTSTLYKLDPQTLKVIGKKIIKYKGHEVHNLNELEYVNDEIWANIWQSDCIARISYKDGTVVGWILLHNLREGLISSGSTNIDVLNGIAWDREKNRLFVTGKLWPKLFEIKLHPVTKPFNGDIKNICMQNPVHFAKP